MTRAGPLGDAISWVACLDGKVVGSLTASLRTLRVDHDTLVVAKLEEMKTDPSVRGRGVMSRVYERVFAESVERVAHDASVRLSSVEPAGPGPDFPSLSGFPEGEPFRGLLVTVA